MTLADYIKENHPGPFLAVPVYFPTGDYLTYVSRDVRYLSNPVDEHLTLYYTAEDGIVGWKLDGVKELLTTAGRGDGGENNK